MKPANQPAATSGCREVKGAAMKAVITEYGCPRASNTPIAEREPLTKSHKSKKLSVVAKPLTKKV